MEHIQSLDTLKSNKFTFIDVYANWCGPCKKIEPKILELSKSHPFINFYKSNIEKDCPFEDMIEVLPTFLLYEGEKLLKKIKGADLKSITLELNKLEYEKESESESESESEDESEGKEEKD
jgi:thioredoxin 1